MRFLRQHMDLTQAIRKDFLPSEIDAIRRALEPVEKASAKERETLGPDARRGACLGLRGRFGRDDRTEIRRGPLLLDHNVDKWSIHDVVMG